MIFNILVDAMVRLVLDVACSPQEAQHGMVWVVRERNLVFYTDYSRIVGLEHEWNQDALALTESNVTQYGA